MLFVVMSYLMNSKSPKDYDISVGGDFEIKVEVKIKLVAWDFEIEVESDIDFIFKHMSEVTVKLIVVVQIV